MSCRVQQPWRCAITAVFAAALLPLSAAAQTVAGHVEEEGTRVPVSGAFVRLLDAQGVQRGAIVTDSAGRFTIRAPSAGTYTLQAERVGHANAVSAPLELTPAAAVEYTIVMPVQPIALQGVPVGARNRCRVRPQSGPETHRLWEEARKVLGVVDWSLNQGINFEIATFRRQLDLQGRPVRASRADTASAFGRRPFVTPSPRQLAEHGFIRAERAEDYVFYAPDAEVLLSDEFLSTHCFWVMRPRERRHAGMIGLAFEPVRSTRLPDIYGTLWLDAATAELRQLEYRYTSIPWGLSNGMASGQIEFARGPGGTWIMQRWSIRIPQVQHAPDMRGSRQQFQHVGFEEAGGEVRAFRRSGSR